MALHKIASAQANGNSTAIVTSRHGDYNYRTSSIYVSGTFNGATVKFQVSPDDGTTWFDVSGAAWTAKAVKEISYSASQVRINVASGGGSESIDCWID